MVTSYYIMKMMANKKMMDKEEGHDNPCNQRKFKKENIGHRSCRVCLQEGTTPIYGNENTQGLLEALQIFGDIQVQEDDDYPKCLCTSCHKFLIDATLFRKTAKQSDEALRQPLKKESFIDNAQDSHDYCDNFETTQEDIQNWSNDDNESLINIIKEPKSEKTKASVKVTCHICNKVLNKSYYKEHITMHDPNHHKYVCDVCGKSFRLRCAYHNHSLRHRNDFPYKCQFCPYRGRYAELLKTHMRTHSGDYRYMCTECPARFLFKSNLNSHMMKHKEPQFKCDSCKRAFHTKLLLQRHFEADHLGIKNHVCNMCGKAFGYRNAMMKHQRHVHKREKLLFGRMPSYLEAEHTAQSSVL